MPKGIHKEDIKAMIRKRGSNLRMLATENGLGSSTVRASLINPIPSGNHIIAQFLGLHVHEIWPQWYDATGQRIFHSRTQSIAKSNVRHCQKFRGKSA